MGVILLSGLLLLSGGLPALGAGLDTTGGSDGVTGSGSGLVLGMLGRGDLTGVSFCTFGAPVVLLTVPGGGAATGVGAVALLSIASGARAVVFAAVLAAAGASAICARRLLVPHTCAMHVLVST